jgi:hypothetical protein
MTAPSSSYMAVAVAVATAGGRALGTVMLADRPVRV